VEMMKKIQDGGFRVVEVPVHHYHRAFGRSQFFNFRRLFKTGKDLLRLRFEADAKSYWIAREPPGPTQESLKNQF